MEEDVLAERVPPRPAVQCPTCGSTNVTLTDCGQLDRLDCHDCGEWTRAPHQVAA